MTGALHAELTGDGTQIILLGAGDDHERSQIAVQLRKLTPLLTVPDGMDKNDPDCPLLCPLSWPAVVQLGWTFTSLTGITWAPRPRLLDWMTDEAIRRTSLPPQDWPDPGYPPWLKPMPHQLDGAYLIAAHRKMLILDEQGTGKTITAILGCDLIRARGDDIFPLVIVVPSWEVGRAWAREIAAWAPRWPQPVLYRGTGRLRHLRMRAPVLITTYATARLDAAGTSGPLPGYRAAAVIGDEIHVCRNAKAKQSEALERIAAHAGTFLGLTGTPVAKNTGDIFPPLKAMEPLAWPAKKRFTERYLETTGASPDGGDDYGVKITGLNPLREPEFRTAMAGSMRRVAKADVLADLPPKTYSVRDPEIPPEWKKAYDDMARQMIAQLPDSGEMQVMDSLALLTRLSQLASSAADVEWAEEWDERLGMFTKKQKVTLRRPSWKAEAFLRLMDERDGAPTVAFTVSRQLAVILGDYCDEAGLKTGYVIGKGGGITDRTRQQAVDDFQAGLLNVIICTAGAGGLGITLTRAGCTGMLQRPWPLDTAVQPEDRTHRIGQLADKVEIIDFVAEGTVDQRVRTVLREKGGQFSELVRDPRFMRELLGGIK